VPQNKPFPDMTVEEAERILTAVFKVAGHIVTLHLTGGGEPFLHPKLPELIETASRYANKFDRLMLFTNSTVPIKPKLLEQLKRYGDKLIVQLSQYGINPEREQHTAKILLDNGINCKIEKYYGDEQPFGGWVNFGGWNSYGRTPEELGRIFHSCAVTRDMCGNWRTRDGKVHWCTRSQRGTELELLPDNPNGYVDLLDGTTSEEKRAKFENIAAAAYYPACDYCSGDQGTDDEIKRYKAAEQMEGYVG
jgi:hypothetical protein